MKISIIIGCYNVSQFLKDKQLACILNQTYKNIEVILVNDGSVDDTLPICKALANQDSRIKLFSKKNGGLGSARNLGLANASGDYVWFYDVDDEVDINLVRKCVDEIANNPNLELLMFGFNVINAKTQHKDIIKFNEFIINENDRFKSEYMSLFVNVLHGNGFNWNKFYKRTLIEEHKIRFGNNRIQQDEVFNVKFYPYVNHFKVMNSVLIDYYIYESGNSRNRYIEDRFSIYKDVFERLTDFNENWLNGSSVYQDLIDCRFYDSLTNIVNVDFMHKDCSLSIKDKIKKMKDIYENKIVFDLFARYKKTPTHLDKLYRSFIGNRLYTVLYFYMTTLVKLRKIKRFLSNV